MWWGIWLSAVPVISVTNSANGWGTIASPLFTMGLLLFLSGMPTAEGSNLSRYYRTAEGKNNWEKYRQRTPPVLPFVPALYASMPMLLKRALCFEFPMYEYSGDHIDNIGVVEEDSAMVISDSK